MNAHAAAARRQESEALRLLTEQLHSLTGYDFRDYAVELVRARLLDLARAEGVPDMDTLRGKLLTDSAALGRAVEALAYRTTTFFRDPDFVAALRRRVFPLLRTYPSVRVWHAGCGTGEETYSLAMALAEEGLLPRCRVYATDLSPSAIRAAKAGAYPLEALRGRAEAYRLAGGSRALSDYYRVGGALAVVEPALRERVTFFEHSFASDAGFNEFQLIVCRGIIPQFNRSLQERAFSLIDESLSPLGVLGVGRRNVIGAHAIALRLEPFEGSDCLLRKVR